MFKPGGMIAGQPIGLANSTMSIYGLIYTFPQTDFMHQTLSLKQRFALFYACFGVCAKCERISARMKCMHHTAMLHQQ